MSPTNGETVLVVNPESGGGDHVDEIRTRASLLGYAIRETRAEQHAIGVTQEAVRAGAAEVVAVGGDGTLNEVVQGVMAADGLDTTTVGVIPAGTGNGFAKNIGVTSLDNGFEVLEHGERRHLDLGIADGSPFLNSCILGLTAEASVQTSSELKSRFGALAYVATTLRVASEFQGLELNAKVREGDESETVWSGSATLVLVGNGRRFSITGGRQANIEDGLLDVTIVEDATAVDFLGDQTLDRLFGGTENGESYVTRMLVSSVELSVETGDSATFSLDGELHEFTSVSLTTQPGALRMPVGDNYEPAPEQSDNNHNERR